MLLFISRNATQWNLDEKHMEQFKGPFLYPAEEMSDWKLPPMNSKAQICLVYSKPLLKSCALDPHLKKSNLKITLLYILLSVSGPRFRCISNMKMLYISHTRNF